MVLQAAAVVAKSGAAKSVARKVRDKVAKKTKGAKAVKQPTRRRRTRLLTLGQREELMWVSRHLGRTAAAERMMHYRR